MEKKKTQETYYTVSEAAEILKVSERTIYRAIRKSELTVLRIGRSTRIPESSFQELLHPATPQPPNRKEVSPRVIITRI